MPSAPGASSTRFSVTEPAGAGSLCGKAKRPCASACAHGQPPMRMSSVVSTRCLESQRNESCSVHASRALLREFRARFENIMMPRCIVVALAAATVLFVSACETVQTTQPGVVGVSRKQRMLVSEQEVEQGAAQAYAEEKG